MKLGDLEFWLITDGTFRLDGGAMFGVIPKPMWERVSPADARNRILMAMNSLLIRAAGKWILIETGAGDKWDAKRTEIYSFDTPPRLPDKLVARGVPPEKIDIIINTHLHFDHCGWNTRIVNGEALPLFPNAQYFVQTGEMEHAKDPSFKGQAAVRVVAAKDLPAASPTPGAAASPDALNGTSISRVSRFLTSSMP